MQSLQTIQIGKREVGRDRPAYIIAEIGSNHDRDLNKALDMIAMAAEAGADAVKFQSIQFAELYSETLETPEFREWFKNIELDESWYPELAKQARSVGVDFLSSPTYESAIDRLAEVGVPAYKLASPQVQGNLAVVEKAARTGKPLILSIGYCEYGDIARAVNLSREVGNTSLILLHCVSKYPVSPGEANLRFIQTLSNMTGLLTGYSDHTLGTHMAVAAVALGACLIEKHVTIDRALEGPDHHFALNFVEFKSMVDQIREVESGLGSGTRLTLLPEEMGWREKVQLKAVARTEISVGERLSSANVQFLRASQSGIAIDYQHLLMQSEARSQIDRGCLITWDLLKFAREDS